MEQSLDDLLYGAFSEVSVGFLENEDVDFENFDFDKFEEDQRDVSQEDDALHQEAAGEATLLSDMENINMYVAENADEEQSGDKSEDDEEDFQSVGISVMIAAETPQEDFTSSDTQSEESSSGSGDDGDDMGTAQKPGDLLMSVRCSDGFCYDNKDDELFAVGRTLAQEGAETPEAGNEEQGESETDEQVSYFGQVPEQAKEMMVKGDGGEEDEQERQVAPQGSEREKIQQEESFLALCSEQELESPYRVEASLEFSELSVRHEQRLSVEANAEEYAEKMKDFSGEEHQEAGETFADYPSDFSSCEYVEGGGENPDKDYKAKSPSCLEGAATDVPWAGEEEDAGQEREDYLYSRDLDMDAHVVMHLDAGTEETGRTKIETVEHGSDDDNQATESDSYSSSDDDDDDDDDDYDQVTKEDELSDNAHLLDPESYKTREFYSKSGAAASGASICDDHCFTNTQGNFNINWDFNFDPLLCEGLLATADTDSVQTPEGSYSVVQREDSKTTHVSYQGSLDDGFFFNTEHVAPGVSELGQLGDDEYEEERNWEQEKERIEAFYKFYDNDAEENRREERQIKVQFCADPLSQVIHYETDSSDGDSVSSSTEGDEDLSSAEISEEPTELYDILQMSPVRDPPNVELPDKKQENDVSNKPICTRKHKCGGILTQILKMGLVLLTGTLMFWLATDQADWFGQISFF